MRSPFSTFARLMRKAYAATQTPIVAVAVQTLPDGTITSRWVIEDANVDEVEVAALSILEAVIQRSAEGEASCPCCADRMARAKAAIAALKPDLADGAELIVSLH